MEKNGKSNGVADAGVVESESASGIPSGNTIAVVGDPGTGKTTFLLNYLTYGRVTTGKDDRENRCGVLCLQSIDSVEQAPVFTALNELFRPARIPKETLPCRTPEEAGRAAKTHRTVRCFVSLENNLARVLDNHSGLLNCWTAPGDEDQYVFVDATAFLSGRLEDKLRYPRLSNSSETDYWKDNSHNFTLGGHKLDEDEHFGLYFQTDNDEPKRIEQLKKECKPFSLKSKNGDLVTHRAFNLITRPIPDPLQRVRLLKDLLAEIFVRYSEEYEHRLLAIDSLSALMNPFGKNDVSAAAAPARRLHMLNLVRWLEEHGVTTFMACEAVHDTESTRGGHPLFLGTEERYLASGVIQLNYHAYSSGDIVRYLRVLKMRGAAHDMRPFAYDLDKNGIAWVEALFGEAGKRL